MRTSSLNVMSRRRTWRPDRQVYRQARKGKMGRRRSSLMKAPGILAMGVMLVGMVIWFAIR